jgi:hypothetical protein
MLAFEIFSWITIGLTLGLMQYWFNLWRGTPMQVGSVGAAGAILGGMIGKLMNVESMNIGAYSMFGFILAMGGALAAQAIAGKVLHRALPAK